MKALRLARAFCGAFALVWASVVPGYAGSVLPLPSVNGPSLGDPTTNIFSIMQQLQQNSFANFTSFTTLTVAGGNTTSTVLNFGFNFLTAAVGVTGTMTLPQAKPGTDLSVSNNTGVNVFLFGNGSTPFTSGGIDYVNGKVSSGVGTPATNSYVLTNGFTAQCLVPQGGNWWCQSGI